ncbi:MAG: FlgB family protein [Pseudomonadota bacterium]
MHQSLDLFQTAHAMARHAGARQAIVAQNIANADTPGYQAKHIAPFADVFRDDAGSSLKTTRNGHMATADHHGLPVTVTASTAEPSPNGNTVSIEEEMMNSVAVSREHNRALTIYRHTMTILRTSLGRN